MIDQRLPHGAEVAGAFVEREGAELLRCGSGGSDRLADVIRIHHVDPADDLAWLLVAAPPDAVESILEAYLLRRTELTDPFLTERALLAGELALARWLLYGVRSGQQDVVDDAVAMLADLDAATSELEPVG